MACAGIPRSLAALVRAPFALRKGLGARSGFGGMRGGEDGARASEFRLQVSHPRPLHLLIDQPSHPAIAFRQSPDVMRNQRDL